jgi:hypothetical protein
MRCGWSTRKESKQCSISPLLLEFGYFPPPLSPAAGPGSWWKWAYLGSLGSRTNSAWLQSGTHTATSRLGPRKSRPSSTSCIMMLGNWQGSSRRCSCAPNYSAYIHGTQLRCCASIRRSHRTASDGSLSAWPLPMMCLIYRLRFSASNTLPDAACPYSWHPRHIY